MKKLIIFSLAISTFMLSGCSIKNQTPTNTTQATQNNNVNQQIINTNNNQNANINENNASQPKECLTKSNKKGFIMRDGNCYAPGENIPDTDCFVSPTGGCNPLY